MAITATSKMAQRMFLCAATTDTMENEERRRKKEKKEGKAFDWLR